MRAVLGRAPNGDEVVYDPVILTNPHVLITGVTGAGKTTVLSSMLTQLIHSSRYRFRVHILDVHNDIHVPDASSLEFTRKGDFGFNPLMVDPDPKGGGVISAIDRFLKILASTANYRIGDKQEGVLRNLLVELFQRNGFFVDNPNSWRLDDGINRTRPKRNPTVSDAYAFAKHKHQQIFLGGNVQTLNLLREIQRKQKAFVSKLKTKRADGIPQDRLAHELDVRKSAQALKESYNDYLNGVLRGDGKELENLLNYPSADVLSGVMDRLEKLDFMKIFSGDAPPFNPNSTVWHYNLNYLDYDDSVIFVSTIASEIFRRNTKMGMVEHGVIRDMLVIDEAKRHMPDNNEDSILSTISNEGRKFGIALVSSSPSHTHFPSDVIRGAATSIMLKQDSSSYNKLKNLTGVTSKDLAQVKPKESALVRTLVVSNPGSGQYVDDNYRLINVDVSSVLQQRAVPLHREWRPEASTEGLADSAAHLQQRIAPTPAAAHGGNLLNRPAVSSQIAKGHHVSNMGAVHQSEQQAWYEPRDYGNALGSNESAIQPPDEFIQSFLSPDDVPTTPSGGDHTIAIGRDTRVVVPDVGAFTVSLPVAGKVVPQNQFNSPAVPVDPLVSANNLIDRFFGNDAPVATHPDQANTAGHVGNKRTEPKHVEFPDLNPFQLGPALVPPIEQHGAPYLAEHQLPHDNAAIENVDELLASMTSDTQTTPATMAKSSDSSASTSSPVTKKTNINLLL